VYRFQHIARDYHPILMPSGHPDDLIPGMVALI
jgi:hypothetical protein